LLQLNNNTNNKKLGVTLIELLISLALISVLLSIGFNTFDSSIREQNSKSASEQIVSAIKKAKYYSRSKGVVTSLSFPTGSNTYSISADSEVISNSNLFDASSGALPKNVEIIQNNCDSINFYVDGSPVDSSNNPVTTDCSIKVGYTGGPQKTITIKGNSGNVIYE
jgi:prepilin-type N-terminal cleavage/methylation domain-containing protein